jgi:2-oxoglutarate dehydrogenase E2 component (dihydrolipoamide succinyltransferase)
MSGATTSVEVRAPTAQEEGTRSQVLRWLKAVGEPVAEHEPLIELETDKVTVEVPSPAAGVLTQILKREQEEVAPGELLGRIGPAAGAAASGLAAVADPARSMRGGGTGAAAAAVGGGEPGADRLEQTATAAGGARASSPAVRRLIAEHALDPAAVRGTGEGGRITVADVMREISAPRQGVPAGALAPSAPATGSDTAASHRVPHSAVRRRIAARMVESLLHTAPRSCRPRTPW